MACVVVVRLRSGRAVGERFAIEAELCADEGQHGLGDQFIPCDQASGMAEGAKLQCQAEPVAVAPSSPDVRAIGIAQHVVPQHGRLVARQVEQRGPLASCRDGTSGHDRILALPPSKRRVRVSLNAIRHDERFAPPKRPPSRRHLNRWFATRPGGRKARRSDRPGRWNGTGSCGRRCRCWWATCACPRPTGRSPSTFSATRCSRRASPLTRSTTTKHQASPPSGRA